MYPIYLLFQGTRLVGRQLQQTVQQTILKLQARSNPSLKDLPASDRAIQQVMGWLQRSVQVSDLRCQVSGEDAGKLPETLQSETLQIVSSASSFLNTHNPEPQTSFSETCNLKPETCQGIASLLETRSLVLVDSANRLWDVLTAEQQQQLYRRVIWEVIDYDRSIQRVTLLNQGFSPPSIAQRRLPLPPDRPQALPSVRRFRDLMAWMQQSPVAIAINLFQEADLATAPIVPTVPSPDNFSGLEAAPASTLIDPDAWCGEKLTTPMPVSTKPWLTMADLFGTQDVTVQNSAYDLWDRVQNNAQQDAGQPAAAQAVEAWSTEETLAIVNPPPSSRSLLDQQELRQIPTPSLTSTGQTLPAALLGSPLILESTASSSSIAPITASSPEHTPDWIETHAETTGYVKHPLEQVLEWLDQLLTRIEAVGIAVWKMIRHRFNP
jgi:hypothetical protein